MTTPPDAVEPTPPAESEQRTDVEYYVEIRIDLGVPEPPTLPTYVWQSEPTLHLDIANAMRDQVSRLIHGLDEVFRARQKLIGQTFVDMPGLFFGVKNRPTAVGGQPPTP